MRKKISFLLIAMMMIASFTVAFASNEGVVPISAAVKSPLDVVDTQFESAVNALVEKGIISGYPDGSFRPDIGISRAEACIVAVKAMGPTDEELNEAAKTGFTDLEGYGWAEKYINFAAAKGVVAGYPDGSFRPADKVSYAEMASMLIRALGYKADELTGDWPDNYISKASSIGIFKGIKYSADSNATRGNVALMTNAVADNIKDGTKPEEIEESDESKDEPGESKDEPGKDKDAANYLADFNGRAYGILINTAKILNSKGNTVDEYEFLIGDKILYLMTNGKFDADTAATIDDHFKAGNLYGMQMNNGVVTGFATSNDGFSGFSKPPGGFEDFTANDGVTEGEWAKVSEVNNYVIKTGKAYGDPARDIYTVLYDASIYVAEEKNGEVTGYKSGSIRDVKVGKEVRLYSITGDNPGVAEVVLVRSQSRR